MTRARKTLVCIAAALAVAAGVVSYMVYREFYAPHSPSFFIDRVASGTFGPGSELLFGKRNPTPMSVAGEMRTSDGVFQLIMFKDSTRTVLIYLHDLKAFSAGIITKGYPASIKWYFHDADLFTRFTKATAASATPSPSNP